MNREKWDLIKNGNNFNINIYRRGLSVVIISIALSCVFSLIIFFIYLSEPERDYYATNGATPPVKLKSLAAANNTSQALLEPDPPTESEERVIPQ